MNSLKKLFGMAAGVVLISFASCVQNPAVTEVSAVKFSPAGGQIAIGESVKLSCATEGAEIWYSTNSAFNKNIYNKAGTKGSEYVITQDVTLYALAVKDGVFSEKTSATFTAYSKDENTALFLGNPSGATEDTANETNYLMNKSTYSLSYNNVTHNPNWVSWHLYGDDMGNLERLSSFGTDTSLPEGWYAVTQSDYSSATYSGYGMTKGHMCPNMDRNKDAAAQAEVFLMTNMVPQTANNNNTVWAGLENLETEWAKAGKELYIICGPYGVGGTYNPSGVTYSSSAWGNSTKISYIPITNPNNASDPGIVVPASTWRVLIMIEDGDSDFTRITSDATVIAVNVPNTYECLYTSSGSKKTWKDYITTVDAIETLTGYDFFANLPDDVENALEAKTYSE